MNFKKATLAALFSIGVMGVAPVPGEAQDGILYRLRAGDSNYCHMRFPAIREDTLTWDRPVLKDSSSGDIVDFYGPCNYDPTGEQAVYDQKVERRQRLAREYNG